MAVCIPHIALHITPLVKRNLTLLNQSYLCPGIRHRVRQGLPWHPSQASVIIKFQFCSMQNVAPYECDDRHLGK